MVLGEVCLVLSRERYEQGRSPLCSQLLSEPEENWYKRVSIQWSACALLMEGFSTRWEIYISNCQFTRLWLAQPKRLAIDRRYVRVKYNSKF